MVYRRFYPRESIRSLVQFFWEFEGDFSESISYEHTLSASVCPKLAFQYEGGMYFRQHGESTQLFRSGFQCQSHLFGQISTYQKIGIFGVYFHPYTISLLFNLPASTLSNQNIEISDLLGREGKQLEERVLSSKDSSERIAIISNYIEKKMRSICLVDRTIIHSVQAIVSQKGIVNIPYLADSYCISQRHFERRFKNLTGFSPKLFSRIVRFEECVAKALSKNYSLTELTYESGYYDQSHMIKDFKAFAGLNPQNYFSEDISMFL
jgi:AraC-like DNA-binding protein